MSRSGPVIGAVAGMLLVAGCGHGASAHPTTPIPRAVAAAPAPTATTKSAQPRGFTAEDALAAVEGTIPEPPAPKTGTWACDLPMRVEVAAAPGVDEDVLWRELQYPVAYMQALGYDVTIAGIAPYELDAQAPDEPGTVRIVAVVNPADQPDMFDDVDGEGYVRGIAERDQLDDGSYVSAALVMNANDGLDGPTILHEFGHAVGLDHKDGTVMSAIGVDTLGFDGSQTAAIDCR